jgi:sugar phosphate isomerase/epimerase
MARPLTLCTGQWADMPFQQLCVKAKAWGYDGLELGCWGELFDVHAALHEPDYCRRKWEQISSPGLICGSISNHLVGQAVCDNIDPRHKSILPARVWGDGEPEGVRKRAAIEMIDTAKAARKFFDAAPAAAKAAIKRVVVNGFTGSSIWPLLYSFPPVLPQQIEAGFNDFAERWTPIMDAFAKEDVWFGLEVHPTEIAFDISSTARALTAIRNHPRFGFNYDPSHFGYQHVDYIQFLRQFRDRIFHVHMKDVYWSAIPTKSGVFGGHLDFGHPERYWDFRSLGHGCIDFKAIIRTLNEIGYDGPLSVEWEDGGMDREHGAADAAAFMRKLDFAPSNRAFDSAFARD